METLSLDRVNNGGNALGQQIYGTAGCLPGNTISTWVPEQHLHYHNCLCGYCYHPAQPHDTEIVIELLGKEIKLNYGGRLRLLMADPVKGHDLRYALAAVQEALLNALG